jgi:hypothetical protein
MTLANEFTNNLFQNLTQYAVVVNGALNQQGKAPGSQLRQLIGNQVTRGNIEVDLNAPQVYAFFDISYQATHIDVIPWSVAQISTRFHNAAWFNGEQGVPVYLVPYEGNRSIGVKLPAGTGPAYAMTATQNGCTFEVSGDRTCPYVSHSNARNVPAPRRQAAIIARAQRLLLAFNSAEVNSNSDTTQPQNDPNQNRAMFGHFANVPGFANSMVDYTANNRMAASRLIGPSGQGRAIKGARLGHGIQGHSRYWLTLRGNSITAITNAPGTSLVVGRRQGGIWTFYHQSYQYLEFDVTRRVKWGNVTKRNVQEGRKTATVITSWGELWPNRSVSYQQFI